MDVKIKKLHNDAVTPSYAKPGDAGMDLTAVSKKVDHVKETVEYGTGLVLEIPVGCVGLLFPRSSIVYTDLVLSNCVGVIDSGYRGEVKFKFKYLNDSPIKCDYKKGDRIGQIIIMPHPQINLIEIDELSKTERGAGGYGHTGM